MCMYEERLDYVLSNWIFVWFILYYFRILNYSPLLILLFGVLHNIILFFNTIYKANTNNKLQFILYNFVIKIIPILIIIQRDSTIKLIDIFATIILIMLYISWLFINDKMIYFYKLISIK